MYAITGITGQVGSAAASSLLANQKQVRAVVRDVDKGKLWRERGCDVAVADIVSGKGLVEALEGVEGVFILMPPLFDPSPGFPEATAIIEVLHDALVRARPPKVVCLSSVGAQAEPLNLLNQLGLMEKRFRDLPMPVTHLRPAWFMENSLWDIPDARDGGVLRSFLQPLDREIPMVATADIGAAVAALLQQTWVGQQVVELEGPRRISPHEIAAIFAELFGHKVTAEIVSRDRWEALFNEQGMKNPAPRAQMIDGFNDGWNDFEFGPVATLKGTTEMSSVLRDLVAKA